MPQTISKHRVGLYGLISRSLINFFLNNILFLLMCLLLYEVAKKGLRFVFTPCICVH